MTMRSQSAFTVIVHDVADPFASSVLTILEALEPLVQQVVAAAIVPFWHGRISLQHGGVLHTSLPGRCGEILLHGCTHFYPNPAHPLALLTANANEFSGLSRLSALARLCLGNTMLARCFDMPIRGFVPPAWQYGLLDHHLLAASGLSYGMRFFRLESVSGTHHPLATWSWDTGRIAVLGLLGHIAGHVQRMVCPDRLPCIVFHPADTRRGFLAYGLRLVQNLLDAGYHPILPGDVWRDA